MLFCAIIANAIYLSHNIYLDNRDSHVIVPEFLSAIHDYEHTEKQILSFINRFEVNMGTEVVKMHRAHWKQIIFAKN